VETKSKDAQGKLLPQARADIAKTCARCHDAIYKAYAQSVHGKGVLSANNPDVPTCTDCHGVHTIVDARGAAFRNSSIELCAKCHTDEKLMSKYNISTAVMNTYVADFHGTTVTLFERQTPDQPTNKPVCYDCHGVHDIMRADDPNKGLQVRTNLLKTCQRCHPDATENFDTSWLSHYIPSPTKYPLVYYVNLVYSILIPVVLGGMALIIATDVFHKVKSRGKPAHGEPAPEPSEPTTGKEE
jgi:predicted CXXCH cytochrome family protein